MTPLGAFRASQKELPRITYSCSCDIVTAAMFQAVLRCCHTRPFKTLEHVAHFLEKPRYVPLPAPCCDADHGGEMALIATAMAAASRSATFPATLPQLRHLSKHPAGVWGCQWLISSIAAVASTTTFGHSPWTTTTFPTAASKRSYSRQSRPPRRPPTSGRCLVAPCGDDPREPAAVRLAIGGVRLLNGRRGRVTTAPSSECFSGKVVEIEGDRPTAIGWSRRGV